MCENLYDVRYTIPDETSKIKQLKISKTLNLNNCTTKPYVVTNVPGVRCVNETCKNIEEVCTAKKNMIMPKILWRWDKYGLF